MPISDADFDARLDWIVKTTIQVVNEQKSSDYHTTVFKVRHLSDGVKLNWRRNAAVEVMRGLCDGASADVSRPEGTN